MSFFICRLLNENFIILFFLFDKQTNSACAFVLRYMFYESAISFQHDIVNF